MFKLRPYQESAISAVFAYWQEGIGKAPLVEVPTGGGKSLIQAAVIQRFMQERERARVVCLTHVKELIEQNYQEFRRLCPEVNSGVYSAGLGRREGRAQILFAGIQSIFKKDVYADLVIIDEAHLVPREGDGMYRTLLEKIREINRDVLLLGLTATPYRLDSGRLDEGDDRIFDGMAYTVPLRHLIDNGWLSPLSTIATKNSLSVHGVRKTGGEYNQKELQAAVDKEDVTAACVREIVARGQDRRSWLVFAAGVDHAAHVCTALRGHGVSAEYLTGETPLNEREQMVNKFKEGNIRALVNVGVLTTGFNAPRTDLIAMLRPTCSTGLYVQMLGRGMRVAEGKTDCLVLDFARNILRHGPVDAVDPKTPVKECPGCQAYVLKACKQCKCGHVFEEENARPGGSGVRHLDLDVRPSDGDVLAKPFILAVDQFYTGAWVSRKSGRTSLALTYVCGEVKYREWLSFEGGWGGRIGRDRWDALGGNRPVPRSVEEAIERCKELRQPKKIMVTPVANGFHRIEPLN
jgi:DNA repair protein RadD